MLALLAELASLKFITMLFVIVAVPALLLPLNSTSPLLVMLAEPAVLVSLKIIAPPETLYVTTLLPPLALLEFVNSVLELTLNVWTWSNCSRCRRRSPRKCRWW